MGLFNFFKKNPTQTANNSHPSLWPSSLRSLMNRYFNPTLSNITVTPENAMHISAYYACVKAISEDIGKLPASMYKLTEDGKKEPYSNSPLNSVLKYGFNDETDSMTGWATMIQWALTFGNSYAYRQTNRLGRLQLTLIHPTRVEPDRDEKGELFYRVTNTDSHDQPILDGDKTLKLSPSEIVHIKGPGNGVTGYSTGELAAESLGISIAAQNFTGAFFGNNLSIGAVLETPRALDPDNKESIRKDWEKNYGGSKNAGSIAILDRDFKFNRIQMASTDAELLNTRKYQVQDIARWFRMPPHKIGDLTQAKFNNVQDQNIDYVTDTIMPWICRLERQLKHQFHRYDDIYIDFDEKGLIRGDMQARTNYYNAMYRMSAMTPSEMRTAEGLPERDDTPDKFYQELAIQGVALAEESQELDNETKKKTLEEPEPEPMPEPPQDEPEQPQEEEAEQEQDVNQLVISAYVGTMRQSYERLVKKEYGQQCFSGCTDKYKSKLEADPALLKQYFDKFYIRHEKHVAEELQTHFNYLCTITGKQKPDNITELAQKVCQMQIVEGWQETRAQEMIDLVFEVLELSPEEVQTGDILRGDDGDHYIMTLNGPRSVDVIPKA